MPTYGYRCQTCSSEFEVWQKMTDAPIAACPSCGAPGRRQFFPAGIVFKGSGFYKTDSRSSGSGGPGGSDGAASSSSKSGSGAVKPDAGKPADAAKSSGESASTPPKSTEKNTTAAKPATTD